MPPAHQSIGTHFPPRPCLTEYNMYVAAHGHASFSQSSQSQITSPSCSAAIVVSVHLGAAGGHFPGGADSGADTVLQRGLCDALAAPGSVPAADAGHSEDRSARSRHLHLPHLVPLCARSPAQPQHQGQIQASPTLQHDVAVWQSSIPCLAFRQGCVIFCVAGEWASDEDGGLRARSDAFSAACLHWQSMAGGTEEWLAVLRAFIFLRAMA